MQRRPGFGGSVDVNASLEQQPSKSKQKHSCKAVGNTEKQIHPVNCYRHLQHLIKPYTPHSSTHTQTHTRKYVSGSVGMLMVSDPGNSAGGGGGPQFAV